MPDELGEFICVVCGFRFEDWDNPCPKCGFRDSIMPLKLYSDRTKRPRPYRDSLPFSPYEFGDITPHNGIITEDGFVRTDNPIPDNRVTNGIAPEFL